jgi:hypothetical protein
VTESVWSATKFLPNFALKVGATTLAKWYSYLTYNGVSLEILLVLFRFQRKQIFTFEETKWPLIRALVDLLEFFSAP